MQNTIGQQPQSVQVPNYSGVNIQIFNPSVAAPGATVPGAVVNSNNFTPTPANSYPPNYYTQNFNPVNNVAGAAPQPLAAVAPATPPAPALAPAPIQKEAVAEPEKKKMEKREIVQINDDYIKNLENYLNSQDTNTRLMGAKEVMARLQEDDTRKNDAALNALINKMLQDPAQQVKFIAQASLSTGIVSGDDTTVKLLQDMQQDHKSNFGEDSAKASEILLKMSGNKVQKEFEVKDKPKSEKKKA